MIPKYRENKIQRKYVVLKIIEFYIAIAKLIHNYYQLAIRIDTKKCILDLTIVFGLCTISKLIILLI